MKTFRPYHFDGCGQYLASISTPSKLSFDAGAKAKQTSELYKVCYNNHCENGMSSVFLVAMSDGMTLLHLIGYGEKHVDAIKDMCDKLNNVDHNEFRFATMDELTNVVKGSMSRVAEGNILELTMLSK